MLPEFNPATPMNYGSFSFPNTVQALIPTYEFTCAGALTELHAQVAGESTKIVFQVWRQGNAGNYNIVADLTYPGPQATRNDSTVSIRAGPLILGIPVRPGDVLGFYLENDEEAKENRFRLLYDNTQETTVYYYPLGTDVPLCNFSTCDGPPVESVQNAAPLISIVFGKQ